MQSSSLGSFLSAVGAPAAASTMCLYRHESIAGLRAPMYLSALKTTDHVVMSPLLPDSIQPLQYLPWEYGLDVCVAQRSLGPMRGVLF